MVIKSKIYDFLKENLGEYLYGFEKNQLDVGLLSGRIELVNVNFRPDKVNEFLVSQGLPVHIKAGLIGKLKLKCSYMSFFTSPLEVELDELLLVFGPISHIYKEKELNQENDPDVVLWQFNKELEILNYRKKKAKSQNFSQFISISESENQSRKADLNSVQRSDSGKDSKRRRKSKKHRSDLPLDHDEEILDPSHLQSSEFSFEENLKNNKRSYTEPVETPRKKSMIEKYFTKILRNLTLSLKSVHISYEDESYPYENPFSMGFSIQKLDIKNISQEWTVAQGKISKVNSKNKTTIKELSLLNLSIYIYSMSSMIIPTSLYEDTIHSEIGIFEAFPAYEVRDFIIYQSGLLSNHASTFLPPTSAQACITFSEEFPNLRAVGLVDSVSLNFTSSMAECIRNFFEYCTNVQLWPLVLRHKPKNRIPPRPEKRERRKERKTRRHIVRSWLQYAYQFVKLKCAAVKYVKDRRKEREFVQKMEAGDKIKEKALLRRRVEKKEEKKSENGSSFASIFNLGKVPGLNSLISGKKPPVVKKQEKRPYDGEKYFNRALCNSEVEVHCNMCSLVIKDDDTGASCEIIIKELFKSTKTLLDEMTSLLVVQDFCLKIGKKTRTEFAKCWKNGKNDFAFKGKFVYRPGEVIIPNDIYNTYNMYESEVSLGPICMNYNSALIEEFFDLRESLILDKAFRVMKNESFLKAFQEKIQCRKTGNLIGKDLKKYLASKKLERQLSSFQLWLQQKIVEKNSIYSYILFRFEVNTSGGTVNFNEKNSKLLMSLDLPSYNLVLFKTKEGSFFNASGFSVRSKSTLAGLYDFLSTIGEIFTKNLGTLEKLKSYLK